MADTLYGRRCKLTLAVPVSTPGDFKSVTTDVVEINGGDDPDAPGLRVRFKVTKTREKNPNPAEITVTNLSDSRRKSLQTKGVRVMLEAGYVGTGLSRIFAGDARTIDHIREGADWSSLIKCGDGERAFRFARSAESFAPGVKAGDVLRYLGKQLGLDTGNLAREAAKLDAIRFDQGYAVWGPVQTQIDRLLSSLGWTYSIQDGTLQVLKRGEVLEGLLVPEITPATGLIGSPEMGTPEVKGKPALCKFKCLLTPTRPGALIKLRSDRYDGRLVVKKCEFEGDSSGGPWYTTVEGILHG